MAVVDNTIHAHRRGFRGSLWVDHSGAYDPGVPSELRMTNLVGDEKSPDERVLAVFVHNGLRMRIEECPGVP